MRKILFILTVCFCFCFNLHAQFTKLNYFNNSNGATPLGDLVTDGTFMYGMTENGGVNDYGTVFRCNIDGSQLTVLKSFSGTDGSYPEGSLILSGTTLYGMTRFGGTNEQGVIFKIQTDGSGFSETKFPLDKGIHPYGSLILLNSTLYGMTSSGGLNDKGVIFSCDPNSLTITNLHDFDGINGDSPKGTLIASTDGSTLYGMTESGGDNDKGTIFKYYISTSTFSKLTCFNGTNGSFPHGSLILSGSYLYGMTTAGGSNDYGTIFKLYSDGTGGIQVLHNFGNNSTDFNGHLDGATPYGSLILNGSKLYGMTVYGGGNIFHVDATNSDYYNTNEGIIFQYDLNAQTGSEFLNLFNFNIYNPNYPYLGGGEDGIYPGGSLTLSGNKLYGMAQGNGTVNSGTIFQYDLDVPIIMSITPASKCGAGNVALGATASFGTINWYDALTGGNLLGSGSSFTATNISQTTTYYIDATYNGKTTSNRTAIVATITPLPTFYGLNDQSICKGEETTLQANGKYWSYVYKNWAELSSSSFTWDHGVTNNVAFTPTTTTTYTVTGTDPNGCTATNQVVITVASVNAGSDVTYNCYGTTKTLTATASGSSPFTYSWSNSATTQSININPAVPTTYIVTVTDANSCTATDDVSINVVDPTMWGGNPKTICVGSQTTIDAVMSHGYFNPTSNFNYSWSPSTGLSSTSVLNPTASPTNTTTYNVTVTYKNNPACSSTGQARILVPHPSASEAAVCYGIPFTLYASNNESSFTYSWNTGETTRGNTQTQYTPTTTYTVTIGIGGGSNCTYSVLVKAHNPTANVSAVNSTICNGSNTELDAILTTTPFPGITPTYTWSPAGSLNNAYVNNPIASPLTSTTYTVTTKVWQCTSTYNLPVTVTPVSVDAGANQNVCPPNNATTLTATGTGSFSWSTGGTTASINVSPIITTTYYVTATNSTCTATDNVVVTVGIGCRMEGIDNNANSESLYKVSAYPNPVVDKFNIEITSGKATSANVRLYNTLGVMLYENKLNDIQKKVNMEMDIHNLSNAMYMLYVETDDGVKTINIIKQ